MRSRLSPPSTYRGDSRKRVLYFLFGVVFLCCLLNFAFMIVPKVLSPGEHLKVHQVPCKGKYCDDTNQTIENIGLGAEPKKDKFKITPGNDNETNKKYCNGPKCKFLLAYYPLPMDKSEAGIEFTTYIKLAELLNRTVVLTNVGASRVSTCQKFPFDLYYDVKKLRRDFPKVNFISQQEFYDWTNIRKLKPSTSHYHLTSGANENSLSQITPYSEYLKKAWCLDKFKLNLNDHLTPFKQIRASWNSWFSRNGRNLLETFLINNLRDDSEVLLIRHDIREVLFLDKLPTLNHAKHLIDAASKVRDLLGSHIVVHWDVQNLRDTLLSKCVPNLISKAQKLMEFSQIENIYFASDYPLRRLNEIVSLNSTEPFFQPNSKWQHVSIAYTKAIQSVSSKITYHTADSLGVMNYLKEALKDEFENSGIRDIIDRLVSVNADWYMGLPKYPCKNSLDSKKSQLISSLRSRVWDNSEYKQFRKLGISKYVSRF